MMKLPTLSLLLLSVQIWFSLAQFSQQRPCEIGSSTKILLSKDPATGKFKLVKRLGVDVEDFSEGQFRFLESTNLQESFLRREAFPGVVVESTNDIRENRILQEDAPEQEFEGTSNELYELYYAWECDCHNDLGWGIETVYCPMDINTCLRPGRWNSDLKPGCRNLPKAYDSKRYSVLFIAAWFGGLVLSLFFSNLGPSLFGFLVGKCLPSWNERAVDRLMRRNPDHARHMIRLFLFRQQRALEQAIERNNRNQAGDMVDPGAPPRQETGGQQEETAEAKKRPKRLALHTCRYNAKKDASNLKAEADDHGEGEGDQCAICFSSFEDGERVGSLKCEHLFHVDCLKIWLQRRNVCPLCQTKEIAEPQYDEVEPTTDCSTNRASEAPSS